MVDSRKSLHAKQQRRRANGEFAEEQDTGLPSGDTLTDFEWKRLNNAMLAAETNIIMDPDVADCAGYATRRLDELIARPAKPGRQTPWRQGGARPGTLGSGHRIHGAGRETPHVPHGA